MFSIATVKKRPTSSGPIVAWASLRSTTSIGSATTLLRSSGVCAFLTQCVNFNHDKRYSDPMGVDVLRKIPDRAVQAFVKVLRHHTKGGQRCDGTWEWSFYSFAFSFLRFHVCRTLVLGAKV